MKGHCVSCGRLAELRRQAGCLVICQECFDEQWEEYWEDGEIVSRGKVLKVKELRRVRWEKVKEV